MKVRDSELTLAIAVARLQKGPEFHSLPQGPPLMLMIPKPECRLVSEVQSACYFGDAKMTSQAPLLTIKSSEMPTGAELPGFPTPKLILATASHQLSKASEKPFAWLKTASSGCLPRIAPSRRLGSGLDSEFRSRRHLCENIFCPSSLGQCSFLICVIVIVINYGSYDAPTLWVGRHRLQGSRRFQARNLYK